MDLKEAEEYTQALAQVVSGSWRQVLLGDQLGVPVTLGLSTREWVEERLGGYVRLSLPERQEAVRELSSGEMTQQKIGEIVGIDRSTVSRDQRANAQADTDSSALEQENEPDECANARRLDALPADLVGRVQEGMDLDEAEQVAIERQRRVDAEVKRVRKALDVLGRMAGYPVPKEVSQSLSPDERRLLKTVLAAIPERRANEHSRAA
jgi:hypothetical protein